MTPTIGRRGLLGGLAAAGMLPYDLAMAQGSGPGATLRVGMTASAVPLANGVPDQGGEGHRFMGITLYDQLVQWDLTNSTVPRCSGPGWPPPGGSTRPMPGAGSSPCGRG
ncbi:hypothetical protein ACFQY5_28440 [Paeniroseomonas aquatica]|uniref:hypothetical protein n=1 Tax=Paeniroseomonas aquatica TaxID=373043 RepID=UPI0036115068